MKKNKIYKKPTLLNIIMGVSITLIQEKCGFKSNITAQPKIKKYCLVKEIIKENPFKKYSTGIYKHKNKKVFIKTWYGKVHNISYYSLINEYLTNLVLQKILIKNHSKVQVPNALEIIEYKNSTSIVFEYIEGKELGEVSLEKQVKVITETIDELIRISSGLSHKEYELLTRRSNSFYIFSFPLLALMTILFNRKYVLLILKAFFQSLLHIPSFLAMRTKLVLSHRDLNLENILLTSSKKYLLDSENMVLTNPMFDYTFISVAPKLQKVQKYLAQFFIGKNNYLLQTYILFHLAADPANPITLKKYFMNKIKEINNL